MTEKRRTREETRELIMRALQYTKKQAIAKKGEFGLREVARHAGVSHTLISTKHPEVAALIKLTKTELEGKVEKKKLIKDGLSAGSNDKETLRAKIVELEAALKNYANVNRGLQRTNRELRAEAESLRRKEKSLTEVRAIYPQNSI